MIQTLWWAAPTALALAPAAALPAGPLFETLRASTSALELLQEGTIPLPPQGYQWELHPIPEAPAAPALQGTVTLPEAPAGYTWVLLPNEQAPAAARGASGPEGAIQAGATQAGPGGYPPVPQNGSSQGTPATGSYPPPPNYDSKGSYGSSSSSGSFHVFLGGRNLDGNPWAPLDDQGVFGVEGHFAPASWGPLELEFGTAISGDEQNDVYLTLAELYAGVRLPLVERRPGAFTLRPYIGGGATWLHAYLEDDFVSGADDGTAGWYARAGLEFLFDSDWSFTIDYRYLGGTDVDLTGFGVGGTDTDLDHGQVTIGLGFYL